MIPGGVDILKKKVALLPHRSGVYRMLSKSGKVLYVGKAKDLKKRVASYTKYDGLSIRLQRMVEEVYDLVVVETPNESEAFLLENELIKKYHPYYNILLKDDKSFPYIFISSNHTFPRISKYRGACLGKGEYFGPYASFSAIQESFTILQKIFLLRSCTDNVFANRIRPCLLYQIKRCSAPCSCQISQKDYNDSVLQAKDFMNGKNTQIQTQLKKLMTQASANQEYEKALIFRDKIVALNHMQSYVDGTTFGHHIDADFIALYKQGSHASIQVFFFRNGKNGGTHVVFFKNVEDKTGGEILATFIGQFYQSLPIPHEIIVSCEIKGHKEIEKALSSKYKHILKICTNVKEGRRHILNQALINAKESLSRHLTETQQQSDMLNQLARLISIPKVDKVEVFDNSHIQGTSSVGAMIVASTKGFEKNKYRRFNIKLSRTDDDFAMMNEVLKRRLIRGQKENDLPDVILIDGGAGQVSVVQKTMEVLNIFVPLIGVAKGPCRDAGEERLYFPNAKKPVELDHKDDLLFFIQRLRDEAHRFAVGSHRIKRKKNSMRVTLNEIEGVGGKRRQSLITYFGTPKAVLEASVSELMKVTGVSENIAKKIYTFSHK